MGKKRNLPKKSALPEAGVIYKNIAWNCFREKYPKIPTIEVQEILDCGLFHEIESYVRVASLIQVAARSLVSVFANDKIKINEGDFVWVLLFSNSPDEDMKPLISSLRMRDYSQEDIVKCAFNALHSVHDEWVRLHDDDFFKADGVRCRFMPFEMIGPEAALRYRIILDEILSFLGWKVSNDDLRRLYFKAQEHFRREKGLYSVDDLKYYLMRGGYPQLSDRILELLSNNERIAEEIVYS